MNGLMTLGTDTALRIMIDRGKTDSSPEVRTEAVEAVGRSLSFAVAAGPGYREEAVKALQGFTAPSVPPAVRQSAYRAYLVQSHFTESDRKFLADAIAAERDPKVRRMAEFARQVVEARLRNAGTSRGR
jgi:hypothetical protein